MSTLGNAVPKRGNRFSQWIARTLMSWCGWCIEGDIPNLPKFVLIGAPHTSNWDFVLAMATLSALNIKVSWMGKHTLFRWPFKGVLKWLGGVPVDRTNRSGGIVSQTIEVMNKRDQFVIALMPEGTRTKVHRWKSGFYRIAQGAKVPIVLVRFDYGRKVIGIGPVIEPSGDITADLAHIQSFFTGIEGKNPHQGVSLQGDS